MFGIESAAEEGMHMFVDFTGVMLVGIATGFVILAHYLYRNPEPEQRQPWAAGFFAAGLLGVLTSLPMILSWPLPGSYNIAFGEPALFLSIAFLAAAITLALKWEPLIPALYGFFGGIIAVVVGLRMMTLGMTNEPVMTGIGYLAAGLGGMATLPAINWRSIRWLALAAAVLLGIAALVFLITGYLAFWSHLSDFAQWLPPTLAGAAHKG
jgi:putative membrane protein